MALVAQSFPINTENYPECLKRDGVNKAVSHYLGVQPTLQQELMDR